MGMSNPNGRQARWAMKPVHCCDEESGLDGTEFFPERYVNQSRPKHTRSNARHLAR